MALWKHVYLLKSDHGLRIGIRSLKYQTVSKKVFILHNYINCFSRLMYFREIISILGLTNQTFFNKPTTPSILLYGVILIYEQATQIW